jgi:hypothetical protein
MALAGDPLELRFKMRLARHRRGTPSSIAEASAIGGKKKARPLVRDGASAYAAGAAGTCVVRVDQLPSAARVAPHVGSTL